MKSDHLFVYGTLMRGFDNPYATLLLRHADFVGTARSRGQLYLIKHYPGMILSEAADDFVFGELYRLHRPDELLPELDMYESCGEGFSEPTEYVRQIRPVMPDDAGPGEAWTYIYNWPVAPSARITSGRFEAS